MDWLISLAENLGPTWKTGALWAVVVLFVLELLRRGVLALDGMRRDLREIKKDIPGMKEDISRIGRRTLMASRWAAESVRRCEATDKAVARLTDAVLATPGEVVKLMTGARNG